MRAGSGTRERYRCIQRGDVPTTSSSPFGPPSMLDSTWRCWLRRLTPFGSSRTVFHVIVVRLSTVSLTAISSRKRSIQIVSSCCKRTLVALKGAAYAERHWLRLSGESHPGGEFCPRRDEGILPTKGLSPQRPRVVGTSIGLPLYTVYPNARLRYNQRKPIYEVFVKRFFC